jgi:hypothetical protein
MDMIRSTGLEQVDKVVDYVSDFCKGNKFGKKAVLVFHSFANESWERALR